MRLSFLVLLLTFLTLFPARAMAGSILSGYTDIGTMESDLGDNLTQIDFTGTPGDTVPDGSVFLDVVITANVAMTYSSGGDQICLTGGGVVGPVIYFDFSQTKTAFAVEISDLDVEAGLVNATSEDLIVLSAGIGPTFWGAIFPDSTTEFFVNPYSITETFCVGPVYVVDADADGYSATTDCDDTDAAINPAASETWYDGIDQNCDGASDYDQDTDGYDADTYGGSDCNDVNSGVSPAATEACDGIDQNCDGNVTDEADADADGYLACNDCDDSDAAVNSAQSEIPYNGIDDDCNASTPDDDLDGDSYGYASDCDDTDSGINPGASEVAYDGIDQDCDGADLYDVDGDGSAYPDDCNDSNSAVSPTAAELCNGLDEDCDDVADEGYTDSDDDGTADCVDEDLDGDMYTPADGDCDDSDPLAYPGAEEVLDDGVDQDCDGNDVTTPDDTGDTGGGDTDDTAEIDDTGSDTGEVEKFTVDDGAITHKDGCGCQVTRFNWDHSLASLLLILLLGAVVTRRRE